MIRALTSGIDTFLKTRIRLIRSSPIPHLYPTFTIITKFISRFARNTLDTITYVRKLKAVGVEVYFEKENLWSLDDKTECLLTIMPSIAQEKSRSISQNVTLGKRWSMKEN